MVLTSDELALVRDEIGDGGLTDQQLQDFAASLTYWPEVALRVLRRRRAGATGGSASSSLTIPGVIAVSNAAANVDALGLQIARLEAALRSMQGVGSARLVRRPDVAR